MTTLSKMVYSIFCGYGTDYGAYVMTEQQIYKILLKNEQTIKYNLECPNLQEETVDLISKNLTNIIYESLKQKSSSNNCKRINTLKFINSTCEIKEAHLNKNIDRCLDLIQKSLRSPDEENLICLEIKCRDELQSEVHYDILDKLNEYYELRKSKHSVKLKCLDFIKKKDQEALNAKYELYLRKKIYFNTNNDVLRNFLENKKTKTHDNDSIHSVEDEKKIMKLAYATTHLKSIDNDLKESVMEKILLRLSDSHGEKSFNEYEQIFLRYLWNTDSEKISRYMEDFFFLLEEVILRHATAILGLTNDINVCHYLVDLENDSNIKKIRKICRGYRNIHLRLKSILYELYYLGFCNANILKLCDLII